MVIPPSIDEIREQIADALIDENDRDLRNLLARVKAAIDWLHDHLQTVDAAYQQDRLENIQ